MSGLMARGVEWYRNARGPRIWSVHFWAEHPAMAFAGLESWYHAGAASRAAKTAIEVALTLAVVALASLSVWLVARPARRERKTPRAMSWLESVAIGAPVACVSLGFSVAALSVLYLADDDLPPRLLRPLEDLVGHEARIGLLVMGVAWLLATLAAALFSAVEAPFVRAANLAQKMLVLGTISGVLTSIAWTEAPQAAFAFVATLVWALGLQLALIFRWPALRAEFTANVCFRCGYDLTGTIEAGREECPECGAVFDVRQSAKPQAA
jgi:hypothetical protein